MIVEKTFYGIKCDACGSVLQDDESENCWWGDRHIVVPDAENSEWIEVRGKHYCPDCYDHGDDDELILADGTVIRKGEEGWK